MDADSMLTNVPLVVGEIDRLFGSDSNSDKPIAGGIPAGKAGKLNRTFAATFTMGQSTTNGSIPESLPQRCGVEDLEEFYEIDELCPKKHPQDDIVILADPTTSTATALHSGLPSSRARYNFQLGLINMAEMLPETRSSTPPQNSGAH